LLDLKKIQDLFSGVLGIRAHDHATLRKKLQGYPGIFSMTARAFDVCLLSSSSGESVAPPQPSTRIDDNRQQ